MALTVATELGFAPPRTGGTEASAT
jgi:hypothetical protein